MIPENEKVVIKVLSQPLIPRSLTLTKRPQENLISPKRRKERYQHNDIWKHYTLLYPKHLSHLFERNSTKDDEGKGRETFITYPHQRGWKLCGLSCYIINRYIVKKMHPLMGKESRVMNVRDVMYWSLVTSSLTTSFFEEEEDPRFSWVPPSPPFTSTIVNLAMCTFLRRPREDDWQGCFNRGIIIILFFNE